MRARSVRSTLACAAAMAAASVVGGLASPVAAQTALVTPAQASAEWKACREQEAEGDARACWRRWQKKYDKVGSEPERAYVQVALAGTPAATGAAIAPLVSPGAVAALNAPKPAPAPTASAPPAIVAKVPTPAAAHKSPAPAANPPPVTPAETPEAATASAGGEGAVVAPVAVASGEVLDFCALAPRKDTTRFVKQRLVLFAPADASKVDAADASVAHIGGARHAREVFAARFALDRFHNVVSTSALKGAWARAATVSVAEVRAELATQQQTASASHDDQAAREAEFVSYSLGCSDWVAIPVVDKSEAKWEEREVADKKGNKKKVQVFSMTLDGAIGIFKREGDQLRLVQTLDAHVPSLVDMATDATAGSIPDVNLSFDGKTLLSTAAKAAKLPAWVSALPDAKCALAHAGVDVAPELASCAKEGKASAALAASSIDERASDICKKADDEKASPDERKSAMVTCEVRARSFQLARHLQTDARSVEGWKLFAPLQTGTHEDKSEPAISLGKDEGVKVGYGFTVRGPDGDRAAYFKATHIGPGGEAGIEDPSGMSLRLGEAREGAKLEEYPLMGITLTPFAGVIFVGGNSGTVAEASSAGNVKYTVPSLAAGGGASVGYDLSGLLGMTETYVRVGGGAYAGVSGGSFTKLTLIPMDVTFEKGFYLGSVTTFYAALGAGATKVMVETQDTPAGPGQKLSATLTAATLRLGFDFLFSPVVALRVETVARYHFSAAAYEEDDGKTVTHHFAERNDKYTMFGGNLALAFNF